MEVARPAISLVFLGLLAACQAKPHSSRDETAGPAPNGGLAAPSSHSTTAQANPIDGTRGAGLTRQCGTLEVQLHCNAASTSCTKTELTLRDGGAAHALSSPAEMASYTAVGLDCVTASNGTPYLVVQYGELPYGCEFCEWYYLYDATGMQLTHSAPIILEDASLPAGKQQIPNNREFEAALDKLGIKEVNTELFVRP